MSFNTDGLLKMIVGVIIAVLVITGLVLLVAGLLIGWAL